jgi:hypothetical protein
MKSKKILRGLYLSLLASLLLSASSFAFPSKVVIIRHGEKLDTGVDLSPRGYQRAEALVGFFQNNTLVNNAGAPVAIYAADPKKATSSMRPIETVTPLAKSLNLIIDTDFNRDQFAALASEILANPDYTGKTVVICWTKETIIDLMDAFGVTDGPTQWKSSVFDRALVLNFDENGLSQFLDIPQNILPGDSTN